SSSARWAAGARKPPIFCGRSDSSGFSTSGVGFSSGSTRLIQRSRNTSNIGLTRSDMLRLSKKADYALIAMKHLALRGDRGSPSAREIAGMYDIPIELMAKVLQRLVQRGLLASHQGTRGGYQLARTPAQITVADVIQAIDGPVTVTACSTDEGQCEQFSKCNVRDPLYRVRERILAALAECSIAELASDPPSPPPAHPAVLHVHS